MTTHTSNRKKLFRTQYSIDISRSCSRSQLFLTFGDFLMLTGYTTGVLITIVLIYSGPVKCTVQTKNSVKNTKNEEYRRTDLFICMEYGVGISYPTRL